MEDCLSKMSLVEIDEDPTNKYNKAITSSINKSKLILNEIDRYQTKNSNPSVPIVYGVLKLHKAEAPLRPVASAFNAPAQKLGKKLSSILPLLLNFQGKYTIKNTKELIQRINTLNLPSNAKLVSFDVTNLFPSIPIRKLKTHLHNKINNAILDKEKSLQLIELIDFYLDQNYFFFNNKFYRQKDGLAMGASLSLLSFSF